MKQICLLVLLMIALAGLAACNTQTQNQYEMRTVVDVWGRAVAIPENVETIVTLGPGASRIAAYLGVTDMIIGAETQTASLNILMDFSPIVYEKFGELPIVGRGGGSGENNAYVEELILISPDVIIAAFTPEAADELQAQTDIPVVAVRYTSTGLANETFIDALRVFGVAMEAGERAWEVQLRIEELKEDLNQRTANIPDEDKLRVYAGAITFAGQRGFGGTYSHFGPLAVINALNVADDALEHGFYEVDLEQIVVWDPDVIFLDPGNMSLVNAEYETNPEFFRSLRAVEAGRVYTMPAFNFSATNITYAFINAYFAGTVLFPEQFADVDIEETADEILTFFLGQNTFNMMVENGLHYGTITIGEQ
ncbi:MAG: ABC transporter substrate-binding protein [Defluviitaleaceae bacterium]|nr:ABC transporter substrate-binding protein [Defluviitaleaceae bacterium]